MGACTIGGEFLDKELDTYLLWIPDQKDANFYVLRQ
jgi:hypothetical protein